MSSRSKFQQERRSPKSKTASRPSRRPQPSWRTRGHLVRLWKPPAAPGETKALGLYRADSEAQLAGLLDALPLYDWMNITVTPLEPHSNDPVSQATVSTAAR